MIKNDANKCHYCGCENDLQAALCHECGTPLTSAREADSGNTAAAPRRSLSAVKLLAATSAFALFATLLFLLLRARPETERLTYLRPLGQRANAEADTPAFFAGARPRDYAGDAFSSILREELTPEEASLVVNPLASTPEMTDWARGLTAGSTNELQRAKRLYDVVAARFNPKPAQFPEPPSAEEVFAAWSKPEAAFACQDFAFLYVALARAVGLKSYPVWVDEDCYGTKLCHTCASVFIAGKALLVDPAYLSFGAAHRRAAVLDDVQTAALYLCGQQEPEQREIAYKLAPRLPAVQGGLFDALARQGRWDEAKALAAKMAHLDPDAPVTCTAQAKIAIHNGRQDQAIATLLHAVEAAPHTWQLHALLGDVYAQRRRWASARESYQRVLDNSVYERDAESASHGVVFMAAMECQEKGDWNGVLLNLDKAIRLRPDHVEAYIGRGSAKQVKGDFDGALADYDRALELQPGLALAYVGRATQKFLKGDSDGALVDYAKAVELDPRMAPAWKMLGWINYNRHHFHEALADFRKACKAEPADSYAQIRIWLARSRLGEMDPATEEFQAYLDGRQNGSPEDWPSKIGGFLVGRLTESEFLKAADSPDSGTNAAQCSDAWFYAGTKRLVSGDKRAAGRYFEMCVDAGNKTSLEYAAAVAESKLLTEPK